MPVIYDDLKQATKGIKLSAKNTDDFIKKFMATEGQRFKREVRLITPVDSGDLRDHWTVSPVRGSGLSSEVDISNIMDYASYVEYGHAKPYRSGAGPGSSDWVDGVFMGTRTMEKISNSMPHRFEAEYDKFLRRNGV